MGALATLGGEAVVDLRLALPRIGAWHADVSVDSASPLSGRVELNVGGAVFSGTVRRGGVTNDVGVYRVVGGAGGLQREAPAKAYNAASALVVLSDLMAVAGESLSPFCDGPTLGTFFPAWVTQQMPVGVLLGELTRHLEAGWRVAPDGTVLFGPETWPASSALEDDIVTTDPRLDVFTLKPAAAELLPGTTFAAKRVSYVEYSIEDGVLVAKAWTE